MLLFKRTASATDAYVRRSHKSLTMRRIIAAGLLPLLPFCAKDDLAARCAIALAAAARAEHIDARATGRRVILNGLELELDAHIENELTKESKWLVGIAVTASAGDGVPLGAGSVGLGDTRAEALDTAVGEWVQLSGVALVNGLVLKEHARRRHELHGLVFYPGPTGFRGPEVPKLFSDPKRLQSPPSLSENHKQLLSLLSPALHELRPGHAHSLSLMLAVAPSGRLEGECRLDGVVTSAILDAAKQFSWPRTKAGYIFKQYYVVERVY